MIYIGADHGGYLLKEEIKKYLSEIQLEYQDLGTFSEESVDYPLMAKDVCQKVQENEANKGILICRSRIWYGYGCK